MKAAEKRENARKTEILRAFGGRLMRQSHAPKAGALPTALHPDCNIVILNFNAASVAPLFRVRGQKKKNGQSTKPSYSLLYNFFIIQHLDPLVKFLKKVFPEYLHN